MAKEIGYYSPELAQFIKETVQRLISSPGIKRFLGAGNVAFTYDCFIGKTTSTISARSGDQWGTGTMTPYLITNDDGTTETIKDSDGEVISLTVYNGSVGVVADDTWIQCKTVGGRPVVDVEYCDQV